MSEHTSYYVCENCGYPVGFLLGKPEHARNLKEPLPNCQQVRPIKRRVWEARSK